jgi:PAS domain S-box-containing protein
MIQNSSSEKNSSLFSEIKEAIDRLTTSNNSHELKNYLLEKLSELEDKNFGPEQNDLESLVSNIPIIVYRCLADKEWTMKFISNEVERLTGFPASDFINNRIRSFASIIHPDDRFRVENQLKHCIDRKRKFKVEYRIKISNNSYKWVIETGQALFSDNGDIAYIEGTIADNSNQKEIEKALIKSERKYRDIFNSITDIFVRTSLDGEIQVVSPSIFDIFGYTPEEVIGQNIYNFYKEGKHREKLLNKLLEKEAVRDFEVEMKAKNGGTKTISLNSRLVKDEDQNPTGIESVGRDITLRKIAEQSLRDRTKELNAIFDNTPVVLILINSDGKVLNINRAATNPDDKHSQGVFSQVIAKVIDCIGSINDPSGCGKGEDCPNCLVRNTIKSTFDNGINQYKVEGSFKIQSGNDFKTVFFLITTIFVDFEREKLILLSLDDITEMKVAQEQIRKLSTAFNQSTATIVITDKKGHIEYANPQFEITTGYTLEEAIGQNPRILKSDKRSAEEYKELWETILKGETWQGEFLNLTKDKKEYWERAIISPVLDDAGNIISFIAIKENITEEKRIQQELMESERELRLMNDEKSRFFSILAHDLRGILGSYHAYSDLLYTHFEEFTPTDMKKQIHTLVDSSHDSLTLLDNLLQWSGASLGRIVLNRSELTLKAEIDSVLTLLKDIAKPKEIELINETDISFRLISDSNVLQTIIRNLVNNAIKFTGHNGFIKVYARKNSEKEIEISVEDNGVGMDDIILKKLFKAGEKVVHKGTDNEKGTGLGLMICDEMVKRLGGKIAVESTPGKGSRFYFIIPEW